VLRAYVEQSKALTDGEVPPHLAIALGTSIQLIPAASLVRHRLVTPPP
jgi:hypothetical protein